MTRLGRAICILLIAVRVGLLTIVLWPLGRPAEVGWIAGVFSVAVMAFSLFVAVGLGLFSLLLRQRENVPWLLALLFFNVLPAVVIIVTTELLGIE